MIRTLLLAGSLVGLLACQPFTGMEKTSDSTSSSELKLDRKFWQDGKAEVSVYELEQNRYNANHPGEVVNVFVLEDFLVDEQVKNETYQNPNSTQVLKNIRSTKFTSGIYDYAIHTSVFTPLDVANHRTLKVTNTMQEWCGTSFLQLNKKDVGYNLEQRSYFEKEGDRSVNLKGAVVEDALFNQVRMDYKKLPVGEIEVIAKLSYLALKHKELKSYEANGELGSYNGGVFDGEELLEYTYSIADQQRKVSIVFESKSPFKIVGFQESYPSAFDQKIRTTTAKLVSSKRLAYWEMNAPKDSTKRTELGL